MPISTLSRNDENTSRVEPLCRSAHDGREVAEINQTIAAGDQSETVRASLEPRGNLGDFELIVDVARARESEHLRREVHADHGRRPLFEGNAGQTRSATQIQHFKIAMLSQHGLKHVRDALRTLVLQIVAHLGFVVRGEIPVDLLDFGIPWAKLKVRFVSVTRLRAPT